MNIHQEILQSSFKDIREILRVTSGLSTFAYRKPLGSHNGSCKKFTWGAPWGTLKNFLGCFEEAFRASSDIAKGCLAVEKVLMFAVESLQNPLKILREAPSPQNPQEHLKNLARLIENPQGTTTKKDLEAILAEVHLDFMVNH